MARSLVIAALAFSASAHAADARAKAVSQMKYMEKANAIASNGKLTPHASLVKIGSVGAGTFMDSHGREAAVVVRGDKMKAVGATHPSKLLQAIQEGHAAAAEMKGAVERLDYNRALTKRGGMYAVMAHTDAVIDGGNAHFDRAQAKLAKAVAKVESERAKQRAPRSNAVNVGEWKP